MKTSRLPCTLLLLAACTNGEDTVTDAPSSAHNLGGVEYSAETLVMESFPVQLRTIVTARNATGDDAFLHFGSPCVTHLRVYDNAARSGAPVYDQAREYGCIAVIFDDTVAAGDTAQYSAPNTNGYEVLGDSLPDGRYWLSASLNPSGQRIEIPAGAVDLAIPRE